MHGLLRIVALLGVVILASPAFAQPSANLPAPSRRRGHGQWTTVARNVGAARPQARSAGRSRQGPARNHQLSDRQSAHRSVSGPAETPGRAKDVSGRIDEIKAELKKQRPGLRQDAHRHAAHGRRNEESDHGRPALGEVCACNRGTDAVLQKMYEKNGAMFDGTQVRARHILLTPRHRCRGRRQGQGSTCRDEAAARNRSGPGERQAPGQCRFAASRCRADQDSRNGLRQTRATAFRRVRRKRMAAI